MTVDPEVYGCGLIFVVANPGENAMFFSKTLLMDGDNIIFVTTDRVAAQEVVSAYNED